jgi:HPt (histidine-containing phosphotransfer) domain-containing protein
VLADLTDMQRNGRPGFVQRVIKMYLQTAAELIGELETASVKNEPAILYRASHTLKPCSATVGAIPLQRSARHCRGWRGLVPYRTQRLPWQQSRPNTAR